MVNIIILLLSFVSFSACSNSIFTPGKLWYDNNGEVINAHGGGVLKFKDKYYWFGEVRTDGRKNTGKVSVYSSVDLYNWRNEGIALDLSSKLAMIAVERPKVIYNKKNKEFVMCFHEELGGKYNTGKAGIAVAKKITGPYVFYSDFWPNASVEPIYVDKHDINNKYYHNNVFKADNDFKDNFSRGQMFRDMTLFVDDDSTAYVIYESEGNYSIQIAALDESYKGLTGRYSRVLVGLMNEAPTMFKYKNKYYMITSGLKGFSPTDARSSYSDNIFGPWISLGNPVRSNVIDNIKKTFTSQGTFVIQNVGSNNTYIFMADRWQSNSLKDSSYIWLPIDWDNNIPVIRWKTNWKY
ncbi:MAG: glycoside hydrolase family 43 protein [Haemophilus parainfluenzae]|nr:glycoside hydrolase family 43 protein [Haemophilus parainfluenzae]